MHRHAATSPKFAIHHGALGAFSQMLFLLKTSLSNSRQKSSKQKTDIPQVSWYRQPALYQSLIKSHPNGNRTRICTLKGCYPRPFRRWDDMLFWLSAKVATLKSEHPLLCLHSACSSLLFAAAKRQAHIVTTALFPVESVSHPICGARFKGVINPFESPIPALNWCLRLERATS